MFFFFFLLQRIFFEYLLFYFTCAIVISFLNKLFCVHKKIITMKNNIIIVGTFYIIFDMYKYFLQ